MNVDITLSADDLQSAEHCSSDKWLADFRLLAGLGEGGHGRVYLAQQSSLADRPVVLKMSSCRGCEHISLARLQHTNIVPLYWVHEDKQLDQRTLCMPYFGRLTLSGLLEALQHIPPAERTGADIVAVLDKSRLDVVPEFPAPGPVRQFLLRATYVRAMCWMAACLADALHYAHERGLVHLDLKPSNVLIASDGQPMLLDFHLARSPISAVDSPPSSIGGTPAYMSPEQRRLIFDVRSLDRTQLGIDRRSDIYSLGLMIQHSLGGPAPAPDGSLRFDGVARLDRCNPAVSCGLADIVHKCLAEKPQDRYSDAAALAADMRQHLANLPLRGVPNRSPRERLLKWRRRQPYTLALACLGMVLVVVIGIAAWSIRSYEDVAATQRHARFQDNLATARQHVKNNRYQDAVSAYSAALELIRDDRAQADVAAELRHARQEKLLHDLHQLVERIRFVAVTETVSRGAINDLDQNCRALWAARKQLPATRANADWLDLAIISADLRVRLQLSDAQSAHREALAVLSEAEAEYGGSAVLCMEKARRLRALGELPAADQAEHAAAGLPALTSWEQCALGRMHMRVNDLKAAALHFDKAVAAEPGAYWPHFYQGVCCFRLDEYPAAESAFRTCTALQPDSAAAWYNRALAQASQGSMEQAWQSYQRVRQVDAAFDAVLLSQLEQLLADSANAPAH